MAKYLAYSVTLLVLAAGAAIGQAAVTVALQPVQHDLKVGESTTLNVSVTNNSPQPPPIVLVATASYTPRWGTAQTSTASLSIRVRRLLHVGNVTFSIPDQLSYVQHSTTFGGKALTASVEGQSVTVTLDKNIAESGSLWFTIDVRRNR